MKFFVVLTYFLMMLPMLSLPYVIVGIYFSSRFVALFFFPFFLFRKSYFVPKYILPILSLVGLFTLYFIVSIVDNRNWMIYFGYVLTFIFILYFYLVIRSAPSIFLYFLKFFFIANVVYVIFQSVVLNFGLGDLSMIHSNLPAQQNYTIPVFISEPFYRYTGLFNESSPFAFYLMVMFLFFKEYKLRFYYFATFLLLILSGAKLAYLFLLLYFILFGRVVFVKLILILFLFLLVLLYINYNEILSIYTFGQIASINQRLGSINAFTEESSLSLFGFDLGKSSEGEVGLNFIEIFVTGFGLVGLFLFVVNMIWFFSLVGFKKNLPYILVFLLGLMSSGSLLIVQYALIFGGVMYGAIYRNRTPKRLKFIFSKVGS